MNEQFLQFLENLIQELQNHKHIATECEADNEMLQIHDDYISYCFTVKKIVESSNLAVNYINLFQNDINNSIIGFPYLKQQNIENFLQRSNKIQIKDTIEKQKQKVFQGFESLNFNLDFFRKLNFFKNNIVAIGANGSGKTTLSNNLKIYLRQSGVVISAQKILIIPTFSGISNSVQTNQELHKTQLADKSLTNTYSKDYELNNIVKQSAQEIGILLDNLLAENSSTIFKFHKTLQNGMLVKNKPKTTMDMVLDIWNLLIQHRTLECNDGINLTLKSNEVSPYPAHKMSDGEKVALYLIAQVLQAPPNGFIIADEPEMFLHKTILKKLWDRLEQERQDCIFVYLTHDLEFATSRNAKKVWIKSYIYLEKWDIEDIPENELPETLLLELLGSRKPILFCEGTKGSIDEKIFNCLFPEYTITPVESCFSVINYTKAFNKIPNKTTNAFGLIDSDHHNSDRLNKLKQEDIFALSVAEIENLLLQENFLKLLAKQLMIEETEIDSIKNEIISDLEKNIDLQVSNYISTKVDYNFKDSNVKRGNTQKEVEDYFNNFTSEIKISDWYSQRKSELEKVLEDKDYSKVLAVYNNKGLKAIVNKHFKISDFTDRAIKFLQSSKDAQAIIKQSFPKEIENKTNEQ